VKRFIEVSARRRRPELCRARRIQRTCRGVHFAAVPRGGKMRDPGNEVVVFQHQTEAPFCQQSSRNFDSRYQTGHLEPFELPREG